MTQLSSKLVLEKVDNQSRDSNLQRETNLNFHRERLITIKPYRNKSTCSLHNYTVAFEIFKNIRIKVLGMHRISNFFGGISFNNSAELQNNLVMAWSVTNRIAVYRDHYKIANSYSLYT